MDLLYIVYQYSPNCDVLDKLIVIRKNHKKNTF